MFESYVTGCLNTAEAHCYKRESKETLAFFNKILKAQSGEAAIGI